MKKLNKNILVIAPHADDEVLGCGGSILKFKQKGFKVYVVIMTNANKGDPKLYTKKYIKNLRSEAIRANKILKVDKLFFEELPAPNLDLFPSTKITSLLSKYIKNLKITDLILPFYGDLHHDHNKITYSGLVSSRPFSKVKSVMFYETLSETEWGYSDYFNPNYFVSLEKKIIDKKILSFKKYKSQNKNRNHPRSTNGIITLAKYRGSNICKDFAESFKILRLID